MSVNACSIALKSTIYCTTSTLSKTEICPAMSQIVCMTNNQDQCKEKHARKISANLKAHSYLIIHQELRSFKVAGGDSDIVLLSWVVKLGQTPVNKAQLQSRKGKRLKTCRVCALVTNITKTKLDSCLFVTYCLNKEPKHTMRKKNRSRDITKKLHNSNND